MEKKSPFEKISLSNAGTIKKVDGENKLVSINSIEKAIEMGIDERQANDLFAKKFNPCTTEFSIFGTVSCGNTKQCKKSCILKRYDPDTKSWITHGKSKSVAGTHIWKCFCE